MSRLTPEQREEEARSSGISSERAAQLLARAIEQAEAEPGSPSAPPEPSLVDQLEELIDEAWVRRIGAMTPPPIKELAAGSDLPDEQVEGILRSASARIGKSGPVTVWRTP